MKRERRIEEKENKKGNVYPPYGHKPFVFKERRRLSPPQASLGDAECALFKERKKENQAG
jgi:hypothetical protein